MGTSFELFRQAAAARQGSASLLLARQLGVPDRTWRDWRNGPRLTPIIPGAAALPGQITSRTLLRSHLDALEPQRAVLGGRSALWALYGARSDGPCRTPLPLEVTIRHASHHQSHPDVRVRRCRNLLGDDRTEVHGWPCGAAAFTGMDLVSRLDDRAALALLIDMIFHGLVTAEELLARAAATPSALGAARTRRLAEPLLGERSDSIFEWLVRRAVSSLDMVLHPGPCKVQTDDGVFEVDLAVLDLRISIECNGGSHLEPEQQARDARKSNALFLSDWFPLVVTYKEFVTNPDAFLATVLRAASIQRGRLAH